MAVDRRNYRKVYQRIWRNEEFREMTSDAKVLAMYLLTGPQTNRVGLFRFSATTAAEDLSIDSETVQSSLSVICEAFEWRWDGRARVLFIPSWWIYNPLSDGTQNLRGYLSDLNDVPRTALIADFCSNVEEIPESQRHLLKDWESALMPRPIKPETPPRPGQGTVAHTAQHTAPRTVDGQARTTCTETCTETRTETETGTALPREPPPPEQAPQKMAPRGKEYGRIFLQRWQQDELLRSLGPQAGTFDLDGWIFGLSGLADRQGLFLEKKAVWPWVQAQLRAEVISRGLPVASVDARTEPQLGRMNTRLFNAINQLAN